ncbi:MAG: cytochrome b/b6 domain-containing protein [Pseudomonadota bacterium]
MEDKNKTDIDVGKRTVRLWDLPVRLFHWALVAAVVTAWWSNQEVMIDIHEIAGYSVLALVIFRVIWGLVGSSNARFASFLRGPRSVIAYLRKLPKGTEDDLACAGHNPAGGWMVMVLLALAGIQAFSGLFTSEDTFLFFDGPLVKYASPEFAGVMNWIHHTNINLIYIAVGLHVVAAIFYLMIKRENLIIPMITGTRDVPASIAARFEGLRFKPAIWGIALMAVCGAGVWIVMALARAG